MGDTALRTVLAIDPGSTSTKIAVFEDGELLFSDNLAISNEEIARYPTLYAQLPFREEQIQASLRSHQYEPNRLSVVVGRGGLLRPLAGGIYRIGQAMLSDLGELRYGEHASNLGPFLADKIASELGIKAYTVDPVVVDELWDVARVAGHKLFSKRSIFHALNQKAVARRWCREQGKSYDEATLIVAHLGGGVSIGLHKEGRVVDVNNALDGEGPFSAERSGTLPMGDLVRLCFSGQYTKDEVLKMVTGRGGFVSLEGSNDLRTIEEKVRKGDAQAELHCRAFAYGVGKAIGALAAAAEGLVDGIILTGGIAFSSDMMTKIEKMCNYIAPVQVYPGENELEALGQAGLRVLSGEATVFEY
jgi:butyrate kinase